MKRLTVVGVVYETKDDGTIIREVSVAELAGENRRRTRNARWRDRYRKILWSVEDLWYGWNILTPVFISCAAVFLCIQALIMFSDILLRYMWKAAHWYWLV